jgi:hypothetical protein
VTFPSKSRHLRARAAAPDEAAALATLAAWESAAGPLPWAFVLEPAEPGQPWEVRAELPAPDALAGLASLEPADPPGLVEALDRGWLTEEREELHGVVVRRLWRGDEPRRPDLARPRAHDDELARLEGVLAAAVAPRPLLAEESRPALSAVVHRPTGAPGVEVWIGGDPLPDRREVLGAVARAVADEPALWPVVDFDEVLGHLVVRAWLRAEPGPGLPGDDGADLSTDPGWWADRIAHGADVELRAGGAPADHDAIVEHLTPLAEAAGLAGGPARWVSGVFCATWVGELPPPDVLAAARRAPGVTTFAVAPGVPYGLEPEWPVVEPALRVVGGVTWHRLHDPVTDRDHLEGGGGSRGRRARSRRSRQRRRRRAADPRHLGAAGPRGAGRPRDPGGRRPGRAPRRSGGGRAPGAGAARHVRLRPSGGGRATVVARRRRSRRPPVGGRRG